MSLLSVLSQQKLGRTSYNPSTRLGGGKLGCQRSGSLGDTAVLDPLFVMREFSFNLDQQPNLLNSMIGNSRFKSHLES